MSWFDRPGRSQGSEYQSVGTRWIATKRAMVIGQLMRRPACLLGSSMRDNGSGFSLLIGYCRIPFGNGDDVMREDVRLAAHAAFHSSGRNGRLGRSFRISSSSQCGGGGRGPSQVSSSNSWRQDKRTKGDRGESVTLEGQCERGWDKEIEHGGGKKESSLNRRPGVNDPYLSISTVL